MRAYASCLHCRIAAPRRAVRENCCSEGGRADYYDIRLRASGSCNMFAANKHNIRFECCQHECGWVALSVRFLHTSIRAPRWWEAHCKLPHTIQVAAVVVAVAVVRKSCFCCCSRADTHTMHMHCTPPYMQRVYEVHLMRVRMCTHALYKHERSYV